MVTLKEALNLCNSEEEFYLRHYSEPHSVWGPHHYTNLTTLRKKADMQKTKVMRIKPHFSMDGFEAFEFEISGITLEECKKLCLFW